MQDLKKGDAVKIGYAIGERFFEISGIVSEANNELISIVDSDGNETAIKQSFIVVCSKIKNSIDERESQSIEATFKEDKESRKRTDDKEDSLQIGKRKLQTENNERQEEIEQQDENVISIDSFTKYDPEKIREMVKENIVQGYPTYTFSFNEELDKIPVIDVSDKEYLITMFDSQNYYEVVNCLVAIYRKGNHDADLSTLIMYVTDVIERKEENDKLTKAKRIDTTNNVGKGFYSFQIEQDSRKSLKYFLAALNEKEEPLKTIIYRILINYSNLGMNDEAYDFAKKAIYLTDNIEPEFDRANPLKIILNVFYDREDWNNYIIALKKYDSSTVSHTVSHYNNMMKLIAPLVAVGKEKDAEEFYFKLLNLDYDSEKIVRVLTEILNIEKQRKEKENISARIEERLTNEVSRAAWREIAQKENFGSTSKIDETSFENNENADGNFGRDVEEKHSDKLSKYRKEKTKNEVKFQDFLKKNKAVAAVVVFKKAEKKNPNDIEIHEIASRATLYCHYLNQIKDKEDISDPYEKALEMWINQKNPSEAEKMLFSGIRDGVIEDIYKAYMTILDIETIKYGYKYSMHCVDLLRDEIADNDRTMLTSLYTKRSWMASFLYDYEEKVESLKALQSLFVDRKRIAKNYYELGECYQYLGKKQDAIDNYDLAIKYGYATKMCSERISECEGIRGERISVINAPILNFDEVKKDIDDYFSEHRYGEAHTYTENLLSQMPDNKEIEELNEYTSKVLTNLAEYGDQIESGKKNPQRDAFIRAWRIENRIDKAKEMAEEYARKSIDAMTYKPLMLIYEFVLETYGEEAFKKYESLTVNKIDKVLQTKFVLSEKKDGEDQALNWWVSYYRCLNKFFIQLNRTEDIIGSLKKLEHYYSASKDKKRKNRIPDVHYKIGYTYYLNKQYQDSLPYFEKCYSEGYMTPDLCSNIVNTYVALGERDKARQFIDVILSDKNVNQNTTITSVLEALLLNINSTDIDGNIVKHLRADDIFARNGSFTVTTDFFEQYYLGTCNQMGIPKNKAENDEYDDEDLQKLLTKIDRDLLSYETNKYSLYYLSAAYVENKLNGRDTNYFEYISKSAIYKGMRLQELNENDSALAFYLYALEVMPKQTSKKGISACVIKNALANLLKKKATSDMRSTSFDDDMVTSLMQLLNNSVSELGEYTYNELLLLFVYSSSLRKFMTEYVACQSYGSIWLRQLSNYLGADFSNEDCRDYDELFKRIDEKKRIDINNIRNLTQKIITSGTFDAEQLNDIRELRKTIFVCDTDVDYIVALANAYEKGIEINDYNDYENRVATINNVYNQLNKLDEAIKGRVTYFSINFMKEIIAELTKILDKYTDKANKELGPDLSIILPITDIPIVEDVQNVSVTVINKENSANAKNVKLKIVGADGQILVDEFLIAQYIKGGRSVSSELDIEPQGDTYTIAVYATYDGIDDKKITMDPVRFSISSGSETFEPIVSPYYTGDSIDVKHKNVFVGRNELLIELENAIREDKSRCEIIYGQKRCGKSSIANFLVDKLKDDFITIYFSIGGIRKAKNIYREIKENIYTYIEDYVEENGETEKINEELLDKIDEQDVGNGDDFIYFIRWVKRKVCRPFGKELLLVIDEFTHMYRHVNEEREELTVFMDNWKKLIEEDVFKSVLIGQDTMPNFINEFPNQFMVTKLVRVDRLDDDSVRELIEKPLLLPNGESRFMEDSVNLISNWFYGQPFYIQTYCDLLVSEMNHDHKVRVTNALAEKVKEKMLEDSEEVLFNNLISRGDFSGTEQDCFDVLKEIAALTKNSEWAEIKDIKTDNKKELLSDLKNREVVKIQGDKCKILIDFFREWLNRN